MKTCYRCEKCGMVFDDYDKACDHENGHFIPKTLLNDEDMKHWLVRITDGNDIAHCWHMTGKTRYAVLTYLLETFNEESYGMPYGVQIDGIKKVEVLPVDMSNSVWG